MATGGTKKNPKAGAVKKAAARENPKKAGKGRAESKSSAICWEFRLYITGNTPRSQNAIANLKQLCETYLSGECNIQVIDLKENPHLAKQEEIVAIPTLKKILPEPVWVMIGDLSNLERILAKLGLPVSDIPSGMGDSH